MNAAVFEDASREICLLLEGLSIKALWMGGQVEAVETELSTLCGGQNVDLIIFDVSCLGIRSLRCGEELRRQLPEATILYVTDAVNYPAVMEAIRSQRAAYVIKPLTPDDLEYAIETAQLLCKKREKRCFARTFGHFDLFVDEKPVIFKSAKAKELLALLIDRRGGIVTSEQAIGILWEYRSNDEASISLYSKVGKALASALADVGMEDLIITARGMKSINIEELDCDFYRLMNGDESVKKDYFGLYMADYSWAEYRVPVLDRMCGYKG